MAGDGEGATALFEVKVIGAETKGAGGDPSKSVITSSLTKAAIFGHDANWGRILCAMGYSGAQFDPEKVDLFFESAAGKHADHRRTAWQWITARRRPRRSSPSRR